MTILTGSSTGASGDRLPAALALAACMLVALLPVAMALANRSALLVVVLAGAAAGASAWLADRDLLLADIRRLTAAPLAAAAAIGLAYAFGTTLWSMDPATSLRVLGELVLALAGAVALAVALPQVAVPRLMLWVAAGVSLTCILIFADMGLGLPLRRALSDRVVDYAYNRPVVVCALLLWPVLGTSVPHVPSLGVALAGLLFLLCLRSDSGAAMLGLSVGLLAYAASHALPARVLPWLAAGGFAAALLLAPFSGDLAGRAVPEGAHAAMQAHHSRDRVGIWQTFQEVLARRPLTGTGFGSSASVDRDPVAAEVPPEHRAFLTIGHPHNGFLQVWTELGAFGAGLALLAGSGGLLAIGPLPLPGARAAFALAACACCVALVGHGAWQGWWIASAGAAIALIRGASAEGRGPELA